MDAVRVTSSATLPIRKCAIPLRPCVPITSKPVCHFRASFDMRLPPTTTTIRLYMDTADLTLVFCPRIFESHGAIERQLSTGLVLMPIGAEISEALKLVMSFRCCVAHDRLDPALHHGQRRWVDELTEIARLVVVWLRHGEQTVIQTNLRR